MNELLSTDSGGQEIVVRPDHRLPKALLTLVILLAWVGGGLALIDDLFAKGVHGTSILVCSLILVWLGAGAVLALSLLWTLFGMQQVLIRSGDLTLTHRIGPASVGKPKTFSLAHIRGMRIEERKYKLRGKTTVKYTITFDYLGEKRVLFSHLSVQRADSLMSGPLYRFASHTEGDKERDRPL
jgi:hypothetical protein